MSHIALTTLSHDRVILAVPVLPAYRHRPEYVGVLQWCDGPNVPELPGEARSIGFALEVKSKNGNPSAKYYFRALKHTLSLLDCTKKNGDAAVLSAFTKLCGDEKILNTIGQPFASQLADPESAQTIVDFITEHFNYLHETNQQ